MFLLQSFQLNDVKAVQLFENDSEYIFIVLLCVLQKYRQCMAGLLAPPYGVMDSGATNDREFHTQTYTLT